MSTPTPDSEDRGLSARDRAALDGIAGHENAADPAFVARLSTGDTPSDAAPDARATRRWNLGVQIAVVVVIAIALLPSSWLAAGLLVVLLVGPAAAALVAVRAAAARSRGPADDDRSN